MEKEPRVLAHVIFRDAVAGKRDRADKKYADFEESIAMICANIRFNLTQAQAISVYGQTKVGQDKDGLIVAFVPVTEYLLQNGSYDERSMPVIDEPEMKDFYKNFPNCRRFFTSEFITQNNL